MMKKDYYVYGHFDESSKCFYIGKGTDNRSNAISKNDRHLYWHYYVDNHLKGIFSVEIFSENLSEDEALEIEYKLILEHGQNLVNWINPLRLIDYDMNTKYHNLRDTNRQIIKNAKKLESQQLELAIEEYRNAIKNIAEYYDLPIKWKIEPQCLVDKLELEKGINLHGEIEAIDRLTMCLCKLGRSEEAQKETLDYFLKYPDDKIYVKYPKIIQRIYKGYKIPK